jgi:hypothetical protein
MLAGFLQIASIEAVHGMSVSSPMTDIMFSRTLMKGHIVVNEPCVRTNSHRHRFSR